MLTNASREMKSIALVTSAVRPLKIPRIRSLFDYEGCLFFTFLHSWKSLNNAESDITEGRSIMPEIRCGQVLGCEWRRKK